jgi:ribosomal protein S15P/S13E
MLWFRYRWVMTFSHGLCVKIVRGGEAIKQLSNEIDRFYSDSMSATQCKMVLRKTSKLIDVLDSVAFSASALLYREEKDLIKFARKARGTFDHLVKQLGRDKKRYGKDESRLKRELAKLKDKERKADKKTGARVKAEGETIGAEEEAKKDLANLMQRIANLTHHVDAKVHDVYLGSKTQMRETLNFRKVKENISIRSNYRFGVKIRQEAIEASSLVEGIDNWIGWAEKKLGSFKDIPEIKEGNIETLEKYCNLEVKDLKEIIDFVLSVNARIEERLKKIKEMSSRDAKLAPARAEFRTAMKKLKHLKEEIYYQHGRQDRDVKKGDIPKA